MRNLYPSPLCPDYKTSLSHSSTWFAEGFNLTSTPSKIHFLDAVFPDIFWKLLSLITLHWLRLEIWDTKHSVNNIQCNETQLEGREWEGIGEVAPTRYEAAQLPQTPTPNEHVVNTDAMLLVTHSVDICDQSSRLKSIDWLIDYSVRQNQSTSLLDNIH